MASENRNEKKCFTFVWKIENVSYWCEDEYLISPLFTVDEIRRTKWVLKLNLQVETRYEYLYFDLKKQDNKTVDNISIDCELAFLSSDGKVLHSWLTTNSVVTKEVRIGSSDFLKPDDLFSNRSVFLPQDVLTARCKIWKSVGEMSKDVECFARTRMVVEKRSFLWDIRNFSDFRVVTYEINSLVNGEQLMSLVCDLNEGGKIYDELIGFRISPNMKKVKISTLEMCIVDAFRKNVKCFQDEFSYTDACDHKFFTLIYTKRQLLEEKYAYLHGDVLRLSFNCTFFCGKIEEEIQNAVEKSENELPVPERILINDFKSMLNDGIHADIKLKTSCNTYNAHKCILSVRSPVFSAMFMNDMKEKLDDCVNIDDLNDDTVLRMLRYIYNAEVEELEWGSATELYEAADKYQILNLKDICSSYLKTHLVVKNACEALILADMHQDEDLKSFVQNFIMRYGREIMNSSEWEDLAKSNLKLAYDTMRLKFIE